MKKRLGWLGVIVSVLFVIGGVIYFSGRDGRTVDCSGVVEAVRSENETVYLTVRDDWDVVYEVAVLNGTVCRDHFDGSKLNASDIREGWNISCDFKGDSTFADGINYATAKSTVTVYRRP
ncbi:MAG: hypothetical protein IKB04_00145 [Clostridia bacterium]|nr:hypothetical protein [Clostridia bacterium]